MESIIYNYLIQNKDKIDDEHYHQQQGYDNDNQIFLDCLLILSTNRINIDHNTLLDYCNNIVTIKNSEYDSEYYGLNKNQFNILYKIIKSLNKVDNSSKINNSTITVNDHPISSNNSKFDCSILIIIKNNLKLLKQQQQNNNNNNNLSKRIKNNSSGGVDYNYLLFKKVWGNLMIRNEIIFHLKLFKFHKDSMSFYTIDNLRDYKYRDYLYSLKLGMSYEEEGLDERKIFTKKKGKLISSNVVHLELIGYDFIEENSIPSSVNTLKIYGGTLNQKLTNEMFNNIGGIGSDNIIKLVFGSRFNQSLSSDDDESWLPRNLTSLEFGYFFQQTIYPGQLPDSLTSLVFHNNYKGIILPNSIPNSVTTLNYTFNSNGNQTKLNESTIPKSTTNLVFDDDFDQPIEIGDIPHNVTSLTFGESFDQSITSSLPSSITSLKIGYSFTQTIDSEIFSNLKHLYFGTPFVDFDIESLPNTIATLELYFFNHKIHSNLLPKSLTSLSYYSNKTPPNSLPNSITSLKINNVNDELILPNPLPSNLKSITIEMYRVNNVDLSSIVWPTSLETIFIKDYEYSFNQLNNLPADFFCKYIKK